MRHTLRNWFGTGVVLIMTAGWLATPAPGQVSQPGPDEDAFGSAHIQPEHPASERDHVEPRSSARRQPEPRRAPQPSDLLRKLRTPQPKPAGPEFLRHLIDSKSSLLSDVKWDLLSRIALQLLSGNEAELLSGNQAELLSGNEPELLSGNRTELLSGNDPALLSGNRAKLLSENEAELLSGNDVSLFSNIKISIEFSNSGNNNGNHEGAGATNARFQALDQNRDGRLSRHEFTAGKNDRKLRRAKKRFQRLDQDGDFILTAQEFNTGRK